MNTPKKLLRSDIRYQCEDVAYDRGKDYFDAGRVLDLAIHSEGALFVQINSTVRGNAAIPYKQNIRIVWRPDFSATSIDGNCSCPVGYNCKHVAAACFKYLSLSQPSSPQDGAQCLHWLDSLDAPSQQTPQDKQPGEFIVFVVMPGKNAHDYALELIITKEKKTGGLLKGKKTTLSNLRYSYAYLSYIHPRDSDIIRLLLALNTSGGLPILAGALGYLALTKMLPTGRLYWQDIERAPLTAGPDRTLTLAWQQGANGDFSLRVDAGLSGKLLLTEPPLYLDAETLTLGALEPPCPDAEQLKKMLVAPVVPAEYADEFSLRLLQEHPCLPLPAPKQMRVEALDGLAPTPCLQLFGKAINAQQYTHFMRVGFRYDGHLIAALPAQPCSTVKTAVGLARIERDIAGESQAIARLTDLGFTVPEARFGCDDGVLCSQGGTIIESAGRWQHFLHDVAPTLQTQGWTVDIDASFMLDFQFAQNWDAEIVESQNDWFNMYFSIDINGLSYPLLPLIMPVLEHYDRDDLPEQLCIPLKGHSYVNLPGAKLKPFLDVLYELFDATAAMADDGSLRLSRFNAASLADLEQHSYGLFSMTGGRALRELAQKLRDFSGIQSVALPDNFRAELRLYQQHGLNWLQFLREYQFGGILADDMGLGKTIQTLCHLLLEKQRGRMTAPCLIIAPTSLMSNWRREAQRFTPELSVLTLQGVERKQLFGKINDYDLVLTTYPLLPRDGEALLEYTYYYLILDEAQTVKNPLAKAAQRVRQIQSQHRLCLTGTPMENHLGELWAQFDFLMPGFLGNHATFKKLYRTPIEIHGDPQQKQRLSRRIAPFMLRRTKQEVATELPPKTEMIRSVPLYPKQAALYESIRLTMEQKVRQAIAEKGLARSHITILDALLKLRQTCCDPRTLALKEAQKVQESAKLDLLMDMLPGQLEEGRRILIFSQFTRMIALIENELAAASIGYAKLTGQTKKRDEAIGLFKSGAVDVFLISLKTGGVGLNLTEADTVIIYDPWWNPAAESQAADRAYRIGQDKPVFVYKLVTENTVEEKILAMQERKRLLAEGVYQAGEDEQTLRLTADDLTALFEPL